MIGGMVFFASMALAAQTEPVKPCPAMQLEGLSAVQQATILSARSDVCAILASPQFEADLSTQQLEWACPGFFFAARKRIEPADVLHALRNEVPEFAVALGSFRNGNVTAETSISARRIRISEHWLDRASVDGSKERGDLVNTLAHEMTHLIPAPGDANGFRFADRGQSMPWCKRTRLVSYSVGDTAERLWRGGLRSEWVSRAGTGFR